MEKRKKPKSFFKKFWGMMMYLVLGVSIGGGLFFYPEIKTMYREAENKVNNIKEDTFKSAQTSLVYDSDNNVILRLKGEKDVYYLDFENISDYVKQAFIATEDKAFYEHKGIDLKGIMRAAVAIVKNGKISGGGSTITQQLARNTFLSHETSFERKIKEIFISLLLEKKYTKDEILEYYINAIYFANGTYGIEAASIKYFSKPSSELTLAETAFLCAIPNNPTLYNPLTKFENTIKRQQRMLGYMLEDGYITQDEYDSALSEEIELKVSKNQTNNYVDTYVIDTATEALMQANGFELKTEFKNDRERENYNKTYNEVYSETQKQLYTGGYRIYTSIDMEKQAILQEAVNNELKDFSKKSSDGIYSFQGAATSIDNQTGKVVAIVGGRSQEGVGYTLNRAFQSFRQPGSTFKPLVVYTPIFEGDYIPAMLVDDTKEADGPRNYNGKYEGVISIRYAVEQSKNTIAWKLLREIGPKKGLSYVRKMGFEKIVDSDNVLSSALGGLTYGASTLEMASAYSALSRDGYFYKPTAILKITDAQGKVIYADSTEPIKVYTEKGSRIMTNVLQSVMRNGTGARLQLSNMPSAGKTGSTNDLKDGWFAGYTPYYTTVVWVGYDIPQAVDGLYGSSYPGRIWKNYMNKIHEGLKYKDFKEFTGLKEQEDAYNEMIKAEEEKKVLIDEIESNLEIYLNKAINSLADVSSLENIHALLIDRLGKLTDEEAKLGYEQAINKRKAYVDSKKQELESIQPVIPEVVPEPTPEVVPDTTPSEVPEAA